MKKSFDMRNKNLSTYWNKDQFADVRYVLQKYLFFLGNKWIANRSPSGPLYINDSQIYFVDSGVITRGRVLRINSIEEINVKEFLSDLPKEFILEELSRIWRALEESGSDDKSSVLGASFYRHWCPACHYIEPVPEVQLFINKCKTSCVMIDTWPDGCTFGESPYKNWGGSAHSAERSHYAGKIADAAEKLLRDLNGHKVKSPIPRTKPLNLEGCDPEIAENLRAGLATLCKIGAYTDYVIGFRYETGEYITEQLGLRDKVKPVPKKVFKLRSAHDMVLLLIEQGYTLGDGGSWESLTERNFFKSMFTDCGKLKDDCTYAHESSWFEEVEE